MGDSDFARGSVIADAARIDLRTGARDAAVAAVAVEVPVNIVYGSVPYAVMLATPADLDDFVVGFSVTEGLVESACEIRGIAFRPEDGGIVAEVTLSAERFRAHLSRRRNLTGRTGCGLCGVEDLASLPMTPVAVAARAPIAPAAFAAALDALGGAQPLHAATHAVHAAAWCGRDGAIRTLREDVGRHNALDKLIGARLRAGCDRDGFVVVTSRASFEMVEKTAMFGAATLLAISAPTSRAIERARALGLTLLAGVHDGGVCAFSGT